MTSIGIIGSEGRMGVALAAAIVEAGHHSLGTVSYTHLDVYKRQGKTWLWLVADDNFNAWQRSLLLQFELVDLPPARLSVTSDSKKAAR